MIGLTTKNKSYVLPLILHWSLNALVMNLSSRFKISIAVTVFLTFLNWYCKVCVLSLVISLLNVLM